MESDKINALWRAKRIRGVYKEYGYRLLLFFNDTFAVSFSDFQGSGYGRIVFVSIYI